MSFSFSALVWVWVQNVNHSDKFHNFFFFVEFVVVSKGFLYFGFLWEIFQLCRVEMQLKIWQTVKFSFDRWIESEASPLLVITINFIWIHYSWFGELIKSSNDVDHCLFPDVNIRLSRCCLSFAEPINSMQYSLLTDPNGLQRDFNSHNRCRRH